MFKKPSIKNNKNSSKMLRKTVVGFMQNTVWTYMIKGIRHACHVPAIVMNNGNEMPIIGFGTWRITDDFSHFENPKNCDEQKSTVKEGVDNVKVDSDKVAKAVGMAIDAGYTHIDCTHLHLKQKKIGTVLKKKIKCGAINRDKLFITGKLWNCFHDPENVCAACAETLKYLDVDYLDMYLMHTPMSFQYGNELYPKPDAKPVFSDIDYVDTWSAMEDLVKNQMCKSIGISNFNQKQLSRLVKNCKILPQTLQIEVHPYLTQKDLINYAKCHDICITAYAPIGTPKRNWTDGELVLLNDYKILQLAKKHQRTPGQILLRYQIQAGHAIITKSTDRKHIQENIDILDFELCNEDMLNIESLNHNLRYFDFSGAFGHPHHPFIKTQK